MGFNSVFKLLNDHISIVCQGKQNTINTIIVVVIIIVFIIIIIMCSYDLGLLKFVPPEDTLGLYNFLWSPKITASAAMILEVPQRERILFLSILICGILVVYQITVYRVVINSHKHN
jgi:hypothetical protein